MTGEVLTGATLSDEQELSNRTRPRRSAQGGTAGDVEVIRTLTAALEYYRGGLPTLNSFSITSVNCNKRGATSGRCFRIQ